MRYHFLPAVIAALLFPLCAAVGTAQSAPGACSCGGPYETDFCAYPLRSVEIVVLARILEIDLSFEPPGQQMRISIIDTLASIDTLVNTAGVSEAVVQGQDGANCNAYLEGFNTGDTAVLRLYPNDYSSRPVDFDLGGLCGREHFFVRDGTVAGVGFDTFLEELPGCLGLPTGILDERPASTVAVYPNPARDYLLIESPDLALRAYQLTEVGGRVVARGHRLASARVTLSTAGFPPGPYLLRVTTAHGVSAHRVRIQ